MMKDSLVTIQLQDDEKLLTIQLHDDERKIGSPVEINQGDIQDTKDFVFIKL